MYPACLWHPQVPGHDGDPHGKQGTVPVLSKLVAGGVPVKEALATSGLLADA